MAIPAGYGLIRYAARHELMRQLSSELFPAAAALLSEAFFENPAHEYICPHVSSRSRQLNALLGGNLRAQPDLSESFCRISGDSLDLMGFWTRIQAPGPSAARMLKAGAAKLPFVMGVRNLKAALLVKQNVDQDLLECVDGADGWYLNNMVVRSNLRGTGTGTKTLVGEMDRLADQGPFGLFALSTQRPQNVQFYSRLGFEVVRESELGTDNQPFRNWTMLCRRAA